MSKLRELVKELDERQSRTEEKLRGEKREEALEVEQCSVTNWLEVEQEEN